MSRRFCKANSGTWSLLLLFLGYAAIALTVLGANPFKHESITPLDVLVNQRAWHWVDPSVQVLQPERTDIINGLLPTWIAARHQIRDGHVPLWNDRYAGGSTFLVPNNSTYTPGFLVFAATPDPALGFHLAIVFNLAIAGLGMHLFLRRRLLFPAALVGAITFQFCGFHAAWLYWPHVFTSIWIPWLLLAIDCCAETPRLRSALGIAFASSMLILGGFPFVAELTFCAGALLALLHWLRCVPDAGWRLRFSGWYVAGTFLGFLLCAIPLLELHAFLGMFDLGYRENRGSYLDISYLSRLVPPWAYEFKRVEQTMYVGVVVAASAAIATAITMLRWKRASLFSRFGVLLLAISAGLVFDAWPMSWIGWFPGMSFNSWSRAISVMDVALIMLGALALDHALKAATKTGTPHLLLASMGIFMAVQLVEITVFFQRYNGPVKSEYFYPDTPATDYLIEHSGPFDYVIADDSFHISGALGAYGLREWFGHQFRTPGLKASLKEMVPTHFSSHTSSRFSGDEIALRSPIMAAMNVRFLAVSSLLGATGPGAKRTEHHHPLPPLPAHRWVQQFTVPEPTRLRGISVRLATYRRKDLEGSVALTLADESGDLIARATIDAATVPDNRMVDFMFAHPADLAPGMYGFSLSYAPLPDSRTSRLTAWAANEAVIPGAALRVDGAPQEGVVEYVLHSKDRLGGPFRHVLTAHGISVFENMASPRGPYFVADLASVPNRNSSGSVRLLEYTPHRFSLHYQEADPGYIVVPMSMAPGWRIFANGIPIQPEFMRGVLPAIPVTGPTTIVFDYEPWASRIFLQWLIAVLAFIAAMSFVDRRNRIDRTTNAVDFA